MDLIVVFVSAFIGTGIYVRLARKFGIGQLIKEDGPDLHGYKSGTPTMGGIVFVSVATLAMIFEHLDWRLWMSLVVFSILGLSDDLMSILRKDAYGMRARTKFLFQILISTFIVLFIDKSHVSFGGYVIDLGWFYKSSRSC